MHWRGPSKVPLWAGFLLQFSQSTSEASTSLAEILAGFFRSPDWSFYCSNSWDNTGVAAADSLKGLFLGAMLTFAEKYHAVKDRSLLIHWGKNETSTILLGKKSVFIGSSPECQVFVKKDDQSTPSVVAKLV